MIKVEHIETYSWEAAVRGTRNPMNSWDKSDSYYGCGANRCCDCQFIDRCTTEFPYTHYEIGENDLALMKKLVRAGSDHRKFLRQIMVSMDITAPLYWWKEFDTYKVGTVANSCSTMHKIHAREFTEEDFSVEHLYTPYEAEDLGSEELFGYILTALNRYRERYLQTKNKDDWWQMIQLLPSSYNQKRTITLNYEVLLNMYHARKDHKLDEWRVFCDVIKNMPYFEEICL